MISSSSLAAVDHHPTPVDVTISAVHPDILLSHILTRLDGPTLASLACSSSDLRTLSSHDKLWESLCSSTWPSVNDPRLQHLISTFPNSHRSFFSDSYSLIHHRSSHLRCQKPETAATELISAVDLHYQDAAVLSKVVEIETGTGWFSSSPFRVDLLDPKEYARTWVRRIGDENLWLKQLEENLTLSWIVVDPKTKRSMNISSLRPVMVKKHWLSNAVHVKFATVMGGDGRRWSATEFVSCEVEVRCEGKEGGEMQVTDVSMWVEDMEGRNISGKDSLVILRGAMEGGERKGRNEGGKEGKERYKVFTEKKRERKEKMERREKALDMVCIGIGISLFFSIWCYYWFR